VRGILYADREIEDTVGNDAASLLISPVYGNAAKAAIYGREFSPSQPIGDHAWATLHSGGL